LASIFAQVLNVPSVGINDNFFDLGGHSLLAIHLSSQIAETFDIEIPMRMIFESSTVADMAEQILAASTDRKRIENTARILLEIARLSETEANTRLEQVKNSQNKTI
jgi:surfactin family lipopeptide synthetase C